MSEEDRRIFEYFVVAGLPTDAVELTPGAQECGIKNPTPQAPITDVCVIFPSLGEQVPDNFTCVETTPSGYPADLNHGSLRTPSCYLCYRRGLHKPPLVDIGVLYEGKGERVMVDSSIVQTTPFGRPANINNGAQGIYLTYRRAADNAPPNMLAVTDVAVILMNKGEVAPHTFCRVPKNLNKGSLVGSEVYLCYKKSQANANRLAYKPAILDRFPREDVPELPLPPNVAIFCLPLGAVVECWPAKCQSPAKVYSTFVLTDENRRHFYGAAVTFFEPYDGALTPEQLERLGLSADTAQTGSCSDNSSTNDPAEQMTFHTNRSLCVVSRYPFFTAFKRFLFYLHRMSVTGSYPLPIERYISHLMYEVPFPTPRRPRVLVQLGNETVSFDSCDDLQLPLNGAAYIDFLKALQPDNAIFVMLLALMEQKILVHSLRPAVLTGVAEAICSLMFPFHWQCPYIPQCPLAFAGVLHAPLPFIAGVDSRYFELYEDPPGDVTCVDLDTATISHSDVRKWLKMNMLPRKPLKLLRQTLINLHYRAHQEDFNVTAMRSSTDFMPVDVDYQMLRRRRTLELEIQEAFVRFAASLMKGYSAFLKPIKSAPRIGATDTGALFDSDAFLRSRDTTGKEFYKRFVNTQCFIRFLEERSLISDKNAYNAFFDECQAKVDPASDRAVPKLLEYDSLLSSNHTIFIAPPELAAEDEVMQYTYCDGFPRRLDLAMFRLDTLVAPLSKVFPQEEVRRRSSCGAFALATPVVHRTKQELKSAHKIARQHVTKPLRWAKCLLSYAYSLWFLHLPSYLEQSSSQHMSLKTAFTILHRMESARLPSLDEVCYRILMQLSGQCGKPLMAVKVHMAMQARGLQPNAVTYGIYHRAVLDAKWPSVDVVNAERAWTKLRHAVRAVALFKRAQRAAYRKRRTLSQFQEGGAAEFGASSLSLAKQQQAEVGSVGTGGSGERCEDRASLPEGGTPVKVQSDAGYQSQSTMLSDAPNNALEALDKTNLDIFSDFCLRNCTVIQNGSLPNRDLVAAHDSPAGLLMISDGQSPAMRQLAKEDDSSKAEPILRNMFDGETTMKVLRPTSVRSAILDLDSLGEDAHLLKESPSELKTTLIDGELGEITEESEGRDKSPISQYSRSPTKLAAKSVTLNDPLGLLMENDSSTAVETVHSASTPLRPSPSRTLQLEERRPFEGDEFASEEPAAATPSTGGGGGGLGVLGRASVRGIWNKLASSNSSVGKMIRSHTLDLAAVPAADPDPDPGAEVADHDAADVQMSPSITNLVNQATRFKSRMEDAVQKQQPNLTRLRSGVHSVVRELRTLTGGLELSSPLRTSSLASLDVDAAADADSLPPLDDADDAAAPAHDDPAFLLSTGETGTIVRFGRNLGSLTGEVASGLIEVTLCNCSKCPQCSALLYDEEVMAGWTAGESNLNTTCPFCDRTFVPILTVTLRRYTVHTTALTSAMRKSWYCRAQPSSMQPNNDSKPADSPANRLAAITKATSVESVNSWHGSPLKTAAQGLNTPKRGRAASELVLEPVKEPINRQLFAEEKDTERLFGSVDKVLEHAPLVQQQSGNEEDITEEATDSTLTKEPQLIGSTMLTVPALSPLVLRKEMENVLSGDDRILCSSEFVETHPILFWNLLFFFERLSVPSHLTSWIATARVCDDMAPTTEEEALPLADRSPNPLVVVRCVYDNPTLHESECSKPLYSQQKPSSVQPDDSPLLAALMLDKRPSHSGLATEILDCLALPNLRRPIQLLINEHRRKAAPMAPGSPCRRSTDALPPHCSIYRDVLFLALDRFGGRQVDRKQFDREYAAAFAKLPPRVAAMLPAADRPPAAASRACGKIFMPLDVC